MQLHSNCSKSNLSTGVWNAAKNKRYTAEVWWRSNRSPRPSSRLPRPPSAAPAPSAVVRPSSFTPPRRAASTPRRHDTDDVAQMIAPPPTTTLMLRMYIVLALSVSVFEMKMLESGVLRGRARRIRLPALAVPETTCDFYPNNPNNPRKSG